MQLSALYDEESAARKVLCDAEICLRRFLRNTVQAHYPRECAALTLVASEEASPPKRRRRWERNIGKVMTHTLLQKQRAEDLRDIACAVRQGMISITDAERYYRREITSSEAATRCDATSHILSLGLGYLEAKNRTLISDRSDRLLNVEYDRWRRGTKRYLRARGCASGPTERGVYCKACDTHIIGREGFCVATGLSHELNLPCSQCGVVVKGKNSSYCAKTGKLHASAHDAARLLPQYSGARWNWQYGGQMYSEGTHTMKEISAGGLVYDALINAFHVEVQNTIHHSMLFHEEEQSEAASPITESA